MRAVIYARYSSDNQKETSIEDQIRVCSDRIDKEGWQLVADPYTDYAKSGASLMRPGIQAAIQNALSEKFDVIVTEDLDRISRDQEDTAAFYKRMEFAQVKILTLSDGYISDLHVGLKGTIASRYLKDLGNKTRRGLEGRVLKGKSGGGNSYGYDVVHTKLANGEIEVGERKVNQDQADIVIRIFNEYLRGRSPKKIAFGLNKDGIPGPSGKAWGASTIYGNRQRGTGILNNEIYIGRMIWNRLRYVRDPITRKRVSRLNPKDEWVIKEVPHLRIIDQDLWERVRAEQRTYTKSDKPLNNTNRPVYLLSGLLKCGCCGGGYSMVSPTHLGCSTARNKGTCDNRKTIKREKLEGLVIDGLQKNLMDKELCAKFCTEYVNHLNQIRREHNSLRASYERELAKIERENKKLVDAILNDVDPKTLVEKSRYIAARKEELTEILERVEEAPVIFHPNMADRYHEEVSELIDSLSSLEHREEAASLLRDLIDKIVLTPNEDSTDLNIDLMGDLAGILTVATRNNVALVKDGIAWLSKQEQPSTDAEPSHDSANKDSMVAGVRNTSDLIDVKAACKDVMVAGVGFEPTTFRL
ncbi:MAG: recombinase family protein [Pseudomonadota bacterium]